jgi:hypothetical protein
MSPLDKEFFDLMGLSANHENEFMQLMRKFEREKEEANEEAKEEDATDEAIEEDEKEKNESPVTSENLLCLDRVCSVGGNCTESLPEELLRCNLAPNLRWKR